MLPQDVYQYLILAGIALLIIEVVILGFSTFFLFFLGVAAIITGGLVFADILTNWIQVIVSLAVITAVSAGLLWQPLKRMQKTQGIKQVATDFDGYEFTCEHAITPNGDSSYAYSGITWKLYSDELIPANSKVKVVKVDVGTWHVKQV